MPRLLLVGGDIKTTLRWFFHLLGRLPYIGYQKLRSSWFWY